MLCHLPVTCEILELTFNKNLDRLDWDKIMAGVTMNADTLLAHQRAILVTEAAHEVSGMNGTDVRLFLL